VHKVSFETEAQFKELAWNDLCC